MLAVAGAPGAGDALVSVDGLTVTDEPAVADGLADADWLGTDADAGGADGASVADGAGPDGAGPDGAGPDGAGPDGAGWRAGGTAVPGSLAAPVVPEVDAAGDVAAAEPRAAVTGAGRGATTVGAVGTTRVLGFANVAMAGGGDGASRVDGAGDIGRAAPGVPGGAAGIDGAMYDGAGG